MNRLILLGNGFDLAHGRKTTYNDFMSWYLLRCFRQARDKGRYADDLIHIVNRRGYNLTSYFGNEENLIT
jgi:hypothetical protein